MKCMIFSKTYTKTKRSLFFMVPYRPLQLRYPSKNYTKMFPKCLTHKKW